jgi:hypothetical protein
MTGETPINHDGRADPRAARARRSGWFSRPKNVGPAPDQEAEVRARLYAKLPPTERTVERIDTVERIAHRPAA